jgi:gas vesicle protein
VEKETVKGLAAGVLVGAAVGAGLGLLLAPQSGRGTRKVIQMKTLEMKERADAIISTIKERDEAFCKAIKEGADNYRREMMAKIG